MKHDFNTLHLLWAIRNIPSTSINSLEKLILFTFLSCTGNKNLLWHNQDTLQEMTCLTRTTLKKYLKSLMKKEFITINKPDSYFRTASNQYTLLVDKIMNYCEVSKGSGGDPLSENKGSYYDSKGSGGDHGRGQEATLKKESLRKKEEKGNDTALRAVSIPPRELYKNIIGVPMPPHVKEEFELWKKNRASH